MTTDQGSGVRIEASPRTRPRIRSGIRRTLTAFAAGTLAIASLAPAALAVGGLTVTTPYPAIVVAPGATVSFHVSISTPTPERVTLPLTGAPATSAVRVRRIPGRTRRLTDVDALIRPPEP